MLSARPCFDKLGMTLRRRRAHRIERGQVLPIWIAGCIAALALTYLTANYANSVRYQIRAQNAADSAAAAVVAIQADQWNTITALLYAQNIEEVRSRHLLDGMLLAIHRSGGCNPEGYVKAVNGVMQTQPQTWYLTTEGTCNRTYIDLRDNLNRSEQRYFANSAFLNTITQQATFATFQTNATAMLASLQTNCNTDAPTTVNAIGGDCGNGNGTNSIKYSFAPASTSAGYGGMTTGAVAYRTGLGAVELDAADYYIPGVGGAATKHGLDTEATNLWAPVAVDVVACEKITPLIPTFGPFAQPTYYAVGRAAATDAMVSEEWIEPATSGIQGLGRPFQAAESYTQSTPDSSMPVQYATQLHYDWYLVDFDSNQYTANATKLTATLTYNETSALFGWWSSIPILPFGGAVTTATAC
jgi:hypothetical protein